MHLDDAAAVASAREGDQEAFRLLVDRHGRNLYRLAYRLTGRPEDAEDVVQEAFIRAYRQLATFEARANVGTWLYRIAFNCAIDYMRARPAREVTHEPGVLDGHAPPTALPSADDLVYAGEIDGRVRDALRGLTPQERTAFLLRHYHGCSIDEIGRALDLKTNAAKHAVFRAVRKLRIALGAFAAARVRS
ncbi:MAG: sigma-70 family RNA polymerase sigma factor [Acidobacteria bacterium]|nr:sigma-70 family RNA polymerase sigma factor [Acidobacteriota bacterium]